MKFKVALVSFIGGEIVRTESESMDTIHDALQCAEQNAKAPGSVGSIFILRDSEGADHPDNNGKFFLHQIYKP